MAVMTAIAVGSALVSAYGEYKSSQAMAESNREQSQINFLKADEILARNQINNELLQESALVTMGTQRAQIAGSGVAVTASDRRLLRDTMEKAATQITLNNRAAEWEARMVRLGAETGLKSAEEIEKAGTISALGTAGFGTARAFASSPGTEKTKED